MSCLQVVVVSNMTVSVHTWDSPRLSPTDHRPDSRVGGGDVLARYTRTDDLPSSMDDDILQDHNLLNPRYACHTSSYSKQEV
jgi:hypothetical protein